MSCSTPFIFMRWCVAVGVGHRLAAIAQPVAHRLDLVALADDHALAQHAEVGTGAVRRRPSGDQHRLGVVRDHAGHEVDVRFAVGLADEVGTCRGIGGLLGQLGQIPSSKLQAPTTPNSQSPSVNPNSQGPTPRCRRLGGCDLGFVFGIWGLGVVGAWILELGICRGAHRFKRQSPDDGRAEAAWKSFHNVGLTIVSHSSLDE